MNYFIPTFNLVLFCTTLAYNQSCEQLHTVRGGIKIENTNCDTDGSIRFTGQDFEGFMASQWYSLTTGIAGPAGSNGINCWDTNGNGVNDPSEDTNGDGIFSTFDCKGIAGPVGPTGQVGATGATGPQGQVGATGATGPPGPPGTAIIAYGTHHPAQGITTGSGNFTVTWNATTQRFEVSIIGENYFWRDYNTQVTPYQSARIAIADSNGGNLLIQLFDVNGNPVQGPFQFQTIKY